MDRLTLLLAIGTAVVNALPNTHGMSRRQSDTVDPSTIKDCTFYTDYPSDSFPDQGSDCTSIADYWGITLKQFVTYNPSVGSASSCKLTSGYSYCVEENYGNGPVATTVSSPTSSASPTGSAKPSPTQAGLTSDCNNFYFVKSGDYCQAIVDKYGTFSLNDFYSWNPAVKSDCSGLQANVYVCVGVPGTPTSASPTPSPTTNGPQPQQTGITSDCKNYYKVASGDYCQAIVDKYGTFTLSDFYSWNPAIGSDCSHLFVGYYVCVGVSSTPTTKPATTSTTPTPTGPSPTQSGITKDCTKYYKAVSGDTCDVIANDKFGSFSIPDFIRWNPAVGNDCSHLFLDYYYCVAVPGTPTTRTHTTASATPTPTSNGPQPQQPGIVSNCNRFYKVQSGDSCYTIEQSKNLSDSQFYGWNTGIKRDCSNLFVDYYVCVGVS